MGRLTVPLICVVLLLVGTGPAGTADTRPGHIAVEAQTSLSVNCFGSCPANFDDFFGETVDGVDGAASSSYDRDKGTARASVDEAAGSLRAYLSGGISLPALPAGSAASSQGSATSEIADTITLSEAATIILEGTIDGEISLSRGLGGDGVSNPVTFGAEIKFTGDIVGENREVFGSFTRSYIDGDAPDETFSVPIDLPAGTSNFNAAVRAFTDFRISSGHAESGTIDFASSLTFRVVVPAGVTATSGSGLLPGATGKTPTLSIADAQVTEGDFSTTQLELPVTLSAPSSGVVTVNFATADGSATAGEDYVPATGTLTFAPGEMAKTIVVPITGDHLAEDDEDLVVHLEKANGAGISAALAVGTIVDDDAPPELSIDDITIAEGNSSTTDAVFTVRLSAPAKQPFSVDVATADGTAIEGFDYTATQRTLAFAVGETAQEVRVPVLGDTLVEPDERFHVDLSNATGATIGDAQADATIVNDDEGRRQADLEVMATLQTTAPLVVGEPFKLLVTVKNNGPQTATLPILRYAFGDETLVAQPSSVIEVVSVEPTLTCGDSGLPNMTECALPPAANGGGTQVQLTVVAHRAGAYVAHLEARNPPEDDPSTSNNVRQLRLDLALPMISIEDVSIPEGNSGSSNAVAHVSLSAANYDPVTVNYATADGSATAGSDYAASSGSLTFSRGETTKAISVPIQGDVLDEADESFLVNLSAPAGAALADSQGTVTILDDDDPPRPSISVNDVSVTEGDFGAKFVSFQLRLSNDSRQEVRVDVRVGGVTATPGVDFSPVTRTLTFLPGVTTKTVAVQIIGDLLDEPDETFRATLSAPINATIADGEGIGTIVDDDPPSVGPRQQAA